MSFDREIFMSVKMRRYLLSAIFISALLLRIIVAIHSISVLKGDEVAYDKYAKSIVAGEGFSDNGKPTSFRPPLYVFLVSFFYYFFGQNYLMIKLFQALIGAFTCLVVYFLAKEGFSEKIGVFSAILSVFYPPFVYASSRILSEVIFVFFFTVSMFYLVRLRASLSRANCIVLGLSLGLAALTKAIVQIFPLIIFICLYFYRKGDKPFSRGVLRPFAVIVVSFLLPIIPWTLRNYHAHHAFVPITTETGEAFYSSYSPRDGKIFGFSPDDDNIKQWRLISSEAEGSLFLVKKTIELIKGNHRNVFLKMAPLKVFYFWSAFDWEIIGNGVYNFMYVFMLPFAIVAMFASRKEWRRYLPLYLAIFYCFGMAVIFYGSPRFRLLIDPYLIIFASAGIFWFLKVFSKRATPILIISVFFLINIALFLHPAFVKRGAQRLLAGLGIW